MWFLCCLIKYELDKDVCSFEKKYFYCCYSTKVTCAFLLQENSFKPRKSTIYYTLVTMPSLHGGSFQVTLTVPLILLKLLKIPGLKYNQESWTMAHGPKTDKSVFKIWEKFKIYVFTPLAFFLLKNLVSSNFVLIESR